MFFQMGRSYAFYGHDAAKAAAVLGIKAVKNGRVPSSIYRNSGGAAVAFSMVLEKKFAARAIAKGYSVYVIKEDKSVLFDGRLIARVLVKYSPVKGVPEAV